MLFVNFVGLLVLIGPLALVVYLIVRGAGREYGGGSAEGKVVTTILIVLVVAAVAITAFEIQQRRRAQTTTPPSLFGPAAADTQSEPENSE